ncbi:hypothetical protein [Thalassovita aquimarina]|uniref:Excalibur calcium-binding domain-containing protein n=1 Tax=Thalassovita aquimarina TaxID=2785917 RepID=A0ABS5HU77_9RHOB|nr:hypothetical protein [Thalassovita aquimarina]MBR9652509.1 hypothetical protein [Thalassovita aquimarina]
MRYVIPSLAMLALAACDATIPDSGVGVGFKNYDDYQQAQAQRDAQLAGQPLVDPLAVSQEQSAAATDMQGPLSTVASTLPETEAERLAAETAAALNSGETSLQADPATPAPQVALAPSGISRENDFEDVSALRTIESDAQRIEQNKAQYQVVQPTALPKRTGREGPNIVSYALNSSNAVGQQMYKRIIASEARAQRNCARYASPDQAQSDFLAKGGPQKDRMGIDPDGDGFACAWDPAPFRKVNGG